MNTYEEKQAAKKARLQERAEKVRKEGDAAYNSAQEMGRAIPMGQPILVGHHSEKRDRAYRGRMNDKMRKSVEASRKADELEARAKAVGTGGISSDDPEALDKLRTKLEKLKRNQELMKTVNKIARSKKLSEIQKVEEIQANCKISDSDVMRFLEPDARGRVGFASYMLSNNNANIKNVEKRIRSLEAKASRKDVRIEKEDYTYIEDIEDNRICFEFDGKPERQVISILKSNAFKWSPSRGMWIRKITANALYAAKYAVKELDEFFSNSKA